MNMYKSKFREEKVKLGREGPLGGGRSFKNVLLVELEHIFNLHWGMCGEG